MPRRALPALSLLCLLACPAAAGKTGEASNVEFTGHILEPEKAAPDPAALASLKMPGGFTLSVFARDLVNPRMIAVAKDGTVYVTRRSVGDVIMLRDTDNDGKADERKVVANRPLMHGIAIKDDDIFLATIKDVYRAKILPEGSIPIGRWGSVPMACSTSPSVARAMPAPKRARNRQRCCVHR
jgi:glucose/arabinose dehydrogenase